MVEAALARVLGGVKRVRCVLTEKEERPAERRVPKTTRDLVADDPLIKVAVEKYGAEIAEVRTEIEGGPPGSDG